MAALLIKGAGNAQGNNLIGLLGAAYVTALVNPLVDAMVTPEGITMMMKGEQPKPIQKAEPGKYEGPPEKASPSKEIAADVSMGYGGINRFIVRVKDKGASGEPVQFIFHRDGLTSWKLSEVRLLVE
jgi:hypothetical protein